MRIVTRLSLFSVLSEGQMVGEIAELDPARQRLQPAPPCTVVGDKMGYLMDQPCRYGQSIGSTKAER
jgi:hypothetical protein